MKESKIQKQYTDTPKVFTEAQLEERRRLLNRAELYDILHGYTYHTLRRYRRAFDHNKVRPSSES